MEMSLLIRWPQNWALSDSNNLLFQVESREPTTGGDPSPQSALADLPTATRPLCKVTAATAAETKRNHRKTRGESGPKSQKGKCFNIRPRTGAGPRGAKRWKIKSVVIVYHWETRGEKRKIITNYFPSQFIFYILVNCSSSPLFSKLSFEHNMCNFDSVPLKHVKEPVEPFVSYSYFFRNALFIRLIIKSSMLCNNIVFMLPPSLTLRNLNLFGIFAELLKKIGSFVWNFSFFEY